MILAAVALVALSVAACREPFNALGQAGGPSARERGSELFSALGMRVVLPWRDAKYDTARLRIASAAMLPSRVWRDSAVWTSITAGRRELLVRGHFDGTRYRMQAAPSVPFPATAAEARHLITLARLSDDEYAWHTDVPYAIGHVTAREAGAMFAAIFASAEGRTEAEVRAGYERILPRTTRVMGQLFRVDSIHSVQLADRSTSALFSLSLTPDGVEQKYPELAKYLRRYVRAGKMHLVLRDSSGNSYLDLNIANGKLDMRVRTAAGRMMALYGPARLRPDTLILGADITVRVRGFTFGFRNYRGEFRIISGERERSWQLVSRTEPEWVLPLITERLLRTPLRRPFLGAGAFAQIGIRDSAGAQTILARRVSLTVQESAILRFIGRLGAIAVSDYAGDVEREEMAWLNEVFTALLADIQGS
jgi:hypothetical protein